MADEEANVSGEDFQDKKKEGGGKNPILLVLVILNTALMGFVAFTQHNLHQRISAAPSVQDIVKAEMKSQLGEEEVENDGTAKEEDGILFPLEGFTANLAQGDGPRRYIRMNAVLKFKKESNEEEFKARKPQIRDAIISILNSKRPADLLKVEGKDFLKQEIKSAINTFLIDGSVIDIYYVGFQIN